MTFRKISKGFYRSGFRGWIRGPLSILRPQPGKVTTKVVTAEVELLVMQPTLTGKVLTAEVTSLVMQPTVGAKALAPTVTTEIIYSE